MDTDLDTVSVLRVAHSHEAVSVTLHRCTNNCIINAAHIFPRGWVWRAPKERESTKSRGELSNFLVAGAHGGNDILKRYHWPAHVENWL